MPATRLRQLPLNPLLSHTPQKQRQPEDTIPEDSDSVPLGRDVTFTFTNLPDPGLSNLFTPKEKEQRLPAPQGDGENSGDGNSPNDGNLDSGDFNDDDNDDNEVDDHLGDIDEQVPTRDIITTISILANTMKYCEHPWIKVKEPDLFDSTNLQKLINFIFQCQLTFCISPDIYRDDDQKVSFVMTYLCRVILDFFEPYLMDLMDTSDWWWDYSAFLHILHINFSLIDPEGKTEEAINNLTIKNMQKILKYNIEFTCHLTKLGWPDNILQSKYYKGLAPQIKDALLNKSKPQMLIELCSTAINIDYRY